jgi:hypothetical protein
MRHLPQFERKVLAWLLLVSFAANAASARTVTLRKSVNDVPGEVIIPQGTDTITVDWSVASAVVPAAEWNCFNGKESVYSYSPDFWSFELTDPQSGGSLVKQNGSSVPTAFSCTANPDVAPGGAVTNGSKRISVASLTGSGPLSLSLKSLVTPHTTTSTLIDYTGGGYYCPSGNPFALDVSVSWSTPSNAQFVFDLTERSSQATPEWNTPPTVRVLTHKYGTDDDYPSIWQIRDSDTTARPRFVLTGTLDPGGSNGPVDVWFRVIDPADTAQYAVANGIARDDDNRDPRDCNAASTSCGKGRLSSPDCANCSSVTGGDALQMKASGPLQLILETTDQYAGDNYQVLASFDPPGPDGKFPCEAAANNGEGCARSAKITAWKRVYLENESMFRKGAFLALDAPAGSQTIIVTDARPFKVGDMITLIHADPILTARSGTGTFYSERHAVAEVRPDTNEIALGSVTQREQLSRAYRSAELDTSNTSSGPPKPVTYLADGVGIISGDPDPSRDTSGQDFYYADPRHVVSIEFPDEQNPPLFTPAFVEYVLPPITTPYVPFVDRFGAEWHQWRNFAEKWYRNAKKSNYHHLIGATREYDSRDRKDSGARGETVSNDGSTFSLIYVRAGEGRRRANQLRFISEIVAHEIAHQWHTNPRRVRGGEHDLQPTFHIWDRASLCQMHTPYDCYDAKSGSTDICADFTDDNVGFHYEQTPTGVDSEYLWVRDRCEPIPRQYPIVSDPWWTGRQQCP